MRFGSVCSGIEAASVAWEPLGWRACFLSEIDDGPRHVLRHHHADVPLRGDFTDIQHGDHDEIDLLVGGTPCQSFSIAGLRGGLDDARGQLSLEFVKLAARLRPRWLVWENVPGVLSKDRGRAFGSILGALAECGYGFAYRILDAQSVQTCRFRRAVPQRRARVILIGYLGDWRPSAAVLFERACLSGHPAPSRRTGEGAARGFEVGPSGGRGSDVAPTLDTRAKDGPVRNQVGVCVMDAPPVSMRLNAGGMGRQDGESETLLPISFNARQDPCVTGETAGTLDTGHPQAQAVAFDIRGRDGGSQPEGPHETANLRAASGGSSRSFVAYSAMPMNSGKDYTVKEASVSQALTTSAHPTGAQGGDFVHMPHSVRRLTVLECERLQGFGDHYTRVEGDRVRSLKPAMAAYLTHHGGDVWRDKRGRWRTRLLADGPRYKMLGNSMPVNVMDWVGQRIACVESLL